jgi:hypothetical protein
MDEFCEYPAGAFSLARSLEIAGETRVTLYELNV